MLRACCAAVTEAEEKHNMQVAVAGSVIVHTVLLFVMAWLMGLDQTARALWASIHAQREPVKEEPVVTMVFPEQIVPDDAALKPKLSSLQKFIRTSSENESPDKPAKADFTSDRNTRAASPLAASPSAMEALPTQNGVDRPTLELKTSPSMTMPKTEASPLQALPPKEVSKVIESLDRDGPMVQTKLDLEVKPALTQTAPPPAVPKPEPPKESFLPPGQATQSKGTITTKGNASVDAEATPTGRFMRQVTSAVEKRWHELFAKQKPDAGNAGYLKVRFYVSKEGKPQDLGFVERTGNAVIEDLTLEAILKADIPPIPKEVLPLLEGERLLVEYDIVIQ